MKFEEIISITGMPGLYKTVSSRGDGLIVTSLADEKTGFVSARTHGVTLLDNISVYKKMDEMVPLKNILNNIFESETKTPLPNAGAKAEVLRNYFEKILPDHDEERVHISDIKKIIKWYSVLREKNILPIAVEPAEAQAEKKAE
jgi:hypothetical protein